MITKLEISSIFGKAVLETEKIYQSLHSPSPSIPARYQVLDQLEVKSARLEFIGGEKWSFTFSFSPSKGTEISTASGQWLDSFLLERKTSHGHIACRADDWWEDGCFTKLTIKPLKLGAKYIMEATRNLSVDLALAFAAKNTFSTADDVETWLAVDYLLPQKRIY